MSIPSPSSPSQNNPKYLFNEQSRIWRWKAQKSSDEMKAWAKVEWDLLLGSCNIMSDHPEPSTIPIYAHHSDSHENIVKCNLPQGSMQKLIRLQCHWYCEVVLVQTNPFGLLVETIIVAFFGGHGCNIRRCCRPEGTQDVWKDYRFYGNPSKYQYWRYLVISIKEPNPRFVIDLVWCNSKRILIFEDDVEYYEYWHSHHSSSCFWKTDMNPFWD